MIFAQMSISMLYKLCMQVQLIIRRQEHFNVIFTHFTAATGYI